MRFKLIAFGKKIAAIGLLDVHGIDPDGFTLILTAFVL
jgi:hypothetical protein